MMRRLRIMPACVLCCVSLFSTASSAQSDPQRYWLEIRPTGSAAMQSVGMSCADKVVCKGQLELKIDGAFRQVTVFATFMAGTALIKFETELIPLAVGNRPYAVIPVGKSRVAGETLVVSQPTPLALEDDRPLLHRPVMRTPFRKIAELYVDIREAD